jgi:hypothetical protein
LYARTAVAGGILDGVTARIVGACKAGVVLAASGGRVGRVVAVAADRGIVLCGGIDKGMLESGLGRTANEVSRVGRIGVVPTAEGQSVAWVAARSVDGVLRIGRIGLLVAANAVSVVGGSGAASGAAVRVRTTGDGRRSRAATSLSEIARRAKVSDSVGGTASGRVAAGAHNVGEACAGTADLNRIATAIHDGIHLDIASIAALNAHRGPRRRAVGHRVVRNNFEQLPCWAVGGADGH